MIRSSAKLKTLSLTLAEHYSNLSSWSVDEKDLGIRLLYVENNKNHSSPAGKHIVPRNKIKYS